MGTTAGTQPRISIARKAVLPLFLASGAAGLIYEVTWSRALGAVFGNTIFAVSTVLTAFMLGLAVGSWLLGRLADRSSRPLILYALLEVLIGIYAFGSPAILDAADLFYRWFYRNLDPGFYPLSLARFFLSVLILLIPTALMGGTLPVLSKLWANPPDEKSVKTRIGRDVGSLYAINTFGAVAGSFLAGYFFIELLGLRNTIFLAASANVAVGLLALGLHVFTKTRQAGDRATVSRRRKKPRKVIAPQIAGLLPDETGKPVVLAAVAVAGFCSLSLEVLWTRVLVFVLETSAYAFACMLTCFIFGIALGSLVCSRLLLPRIKRPILAMGVIEFLVALSALASVPLLGSLGQIDLLLTRRGPTFSFWKEAAVHFFDASVVLLIPTVFMGMLFPIAVSVCAKSWKTAGRRVGELYACNTVGCVAGSFVAGFAAVPLLGLRNGFLAIIGIQFLLAVGIFFFSEWRSAILGSSAALVTIVLLICGTALLGPDVFLRTINTYHYPSEIVYLNDDATGTVTVHDLPDGDRLIAVDGVDVAGADLMLRTTQKLQAYAPLLVHGSPKKVLQIGFGSGETTGVGLAFGVDQYSIVEICPGVFEAGRFFEQINRGSYKDPRLRKIIMDGKNFVKLTGEKFDIIMNDSTYPGTTGSSALYTYDHFKQCRDRIEPGGVLSCWVPLDLRPEDFSIIVRSFQAVMPNCSLWMVNNCLNKHAVLMGTLSPMRIDFQRTKQLVERPDVAADLAAININSVYELLDCFVVGWDGLRNIGGTGPLHTDDRPYLEFGAAIKRDNEECWIDIFSAMILNHSRISEHVVNAGPTDQDKQQVAAAMDRYFEGTHHALLGLLAMLEGNPEKMNNEFEAAQKVNPEDRDVQSCLNELNAEITALAQAAQRTPADASLRSRLAKRYLLLRDYERAAEHYEHFVELEPRNAAGWNNLGICYNRSGRLDKAVGAFEQAIANDPQQEHGYVNAAVAYGKLGEWAIASEKLTKAALVSPPSQKAIIYDKLAQSYFMQNKYDLALQTLEKASDLASNDPGLRDYLQSRKDLVTRAAAGTQEP